MTDLTFQTNPRETSRPDRPRVVLAGGAGMTGKILIPALEHAGYEPVVLSRRAGRATIHGARAVTWDGASPGDWWSEVDGAFAVINLCGRSVDCRYTAANKRDVLESRTHSTTAIGAAIAAAEHPPQVWLNASTATIYRHALDRAMDERTGEIGRGFSIDVAQAWERALDEAPTPRTRKVALRMAMVLADARNSVFRVFRRLARFGLCGTIGPGNQYVSWIHEDDLARAIVFLLHHDELSGPVNLAAPRPLSMEAFCRAVRQACRVPFGLPAFTWMLEIGTFFLRTETELVLKSRRVVPTRLREAGFRFRWCSAPGALEELTRRHAPRREWE